MAPLPFGRYARVTLVESSKENKYNTLMQKIVCIVGPTAVGKTALSLEIARKFNGALISADSVQVFKGLDIISGKDIPKRTTFNVLPELSKNGFHTGYYSHHNIPIFLLDVVGPTSSFSVSHFHKLASEVIQYIKENDKLPIVVGGTGLYIDSLLNQIGTSEIEPNLELRKKLEQLPVSSLRDKLKKNNEKKFNSMNESDANNPRRLIRAIEIAGKSKFTLSNNKNPYESLAIGLMCDRAVLKQRIDARVQDRLENGALNEAKKLFENYENLTQQVQDANGYKQLFAYLKNEISWDEAIYRWKISEYRHAKNQMTWFKKYGNVAWFDITKKGYNKEIEEEVNKFIIGK